jgi:hypothetical protein
LEKEQPSGSCLGAAEGEHSQTVPAKILETLDEALWLVATVLNHAELFGALAGEPDGRNGLKSVASTERTIGVDPKRKRDALGFLTVASDRSAKPSLAWLWQRIV